MSEPSGKVSDSEGRANCHGAGFDEVNCAPKTHVFIRRAGVPVDPVNAEIFLGGCGGLDGEDVRLAGRDGVGDVEVVGAVGAGDLEWSRRSSCR